jgi:hypothetical protein
MEHVLHSRTRGIGRNRKARNTRRNIGGSIGGHGFDFSECTIARRGNAGFSFSHADFGFGA